MMVPTPVAVPSVAPTGLDSVTENVSVPSPSVFIKVLTEIVADVDPAGIVTELFTPAKSLPSTAVPLDVEKLTVTAVVDASDKLTVKSAAPAAAPEALPLLTEIVGRVKDSVIVTRGAGRLLDDRTRLGQQRYIEGLSQLCITIKRDRNRDICRGLTCGKG